jgi:AcrR family transcriptional regulator
MTLGGMAPGPARPRKDQVRNRKALVEAAKEVFAERGVDAPMDAIAKRAGLSNASLYRHFARREDVLVEVLLANLRRAEAVLAQSSDRPGWVGFVL